jgi:membrane dipeptidase
MITRRSVALGLAALPALSPRTGFAAEDPAMALHRRLLTFDAEMDIPEDFMSGDKDVGRETAMQIDLPKMDRGGLDGAAFVVFVNQDRRTPETYAKARAGAEAKLAAIETMLRTYPDRIALARRAADVPRIVKSGRHFAVISIVNAFPLGEDLSWLPDLYRRGLRLMGFTHAGHNQFADSSRPQEKLGDVKPEHGGLSALGKQAVAEMNRLGIVVDVSQLTPDGVMQATQLSKAPVIASHSAVRALVDSPRNLTDAEMLAIKKTGGVVHIVAFAGYLKARSKEQLADLAKLNADFGLKMFDDAAKVLAADKLPAYQAAFGAYLTKYPPADVGNMADAIDYAVKLIGIDHVGIATDMEHGGGIVGYKDAGEAYGITRELVRRGYSEAALGKIWSGNFLRIWAAVEKAAARG